MTFLFCQNDKKILKMTERATTKQQRAVQSFDQKSRQKKLEISERREN